MTATEHAEAILKATGWGPQFFPSGSRTAILAAVEAAMQDARAEERGRIVDYLMDPNRCEYGRSVFAYAESIEALPHKGAGDE